MINLFMNGMYVERERALRELYSGERRRSQGCFASTSVSKVEKFSQCANSVIDDASQYHDHGQ